MQLLYRTWFAIRRIFDRQLVAIFDTDYFINPDKILDKGNISLIPFAASDNLRGTLSFDFSQLEFKRYNFGSNMCFMGGMKK